LFFFIKQNNAETERRCFFLQQEGKKRASFWLNLTKKLKNTSFTVSVFNCISVSFSSKSTAWFCKSMKTIRKSMEKVIKNAVNVFESLIISLFSTAGEIILFFEKW
jgi:flavodoxin